MKKTPEVIKLIANAMNKHLIPALQKQGKKKPKKDEKK